MTIDIRATFEMDCWPAMQTFLCARYRPDLALCDKRYFQWLFRGEAGEADVTCAWDGDRLVGMLGCVANRAFWGSLDAPLLAAWLTNWMVEPGYRFGVGVALMGAVKRRFPVLLGILANAGNKRIVSQLGWTFHPHIARTFIVFDVAAAKRLALPQADVSSLEAATCRRITCHNSLIPCLGTEREPDWRQYPSLAYATIRDPRYLYRRYLQAPLTRYFVVRVGAPRSAAIAAYRIENVEGSHERVARVIDFFHPEDAAGTSAGLELAHELTSRFAAEGCVFADFVGSAAAYQMTFARAGWLRESHDRPLLPSRFEPPERTPFPYNLEYDVRGTLPKPTVSQLHVTRGDGDADRPIRLAEPIIGMTTS